MRTLAIFTALLTQGCIHRVYPVAGAAGGAALGSAAGPGGSAGGAIIGWGGGKGASLYTENKELAKALSSGDVETLVAQGLEKAKDNGFFDSILDEVYGLMKLCVIGLALWVAVPLLYTRHVHKKTKETNVSNAQSDSVVPDAE